MLHFDCNNLIGALRLSTLSTHMYCRICTSILCTHFYPLHICTEYISIYYQNERNSILNIATKKKKKIIMVTINNLSS